MRYLAAIAYDPILDDPTLNLLSSSKNETVKSMGYLKSEGSFYGATLYMNSTDSKYHIAIEDAIVTPPLCDYYEWENDGKCEYCSDSCKTCSSTDVCTSCESDYLKKDQCVSSCGDGFFENAETHKCDPCTSPCSKC